MVYRSFLVDHRILQLVVDIKFSIPRVVLEPSLDKVYSKLMDISSAILDVLRHIKWWLGPSTGKNLYDILELNGVVETMQSGILQAIQGNIIVGSLCSATLAVFHLILRPFVFSLKSSMLFTHAYLLFQECLLVSRIACSLCVSTTSFGSRTSTPHISSSSPLSPRLKAAPHTCRTSWSWRGRLKPSLLSSPLAPSSSQPSQSRIL